MGEMTELPHLCGHDRNSNPYALLGIKSCERDERIIAKRGKALKASLHPDKNRGNEYANAAFIMSTDAVDLLSNQYTRGMCDGVLFREGRCFTTVKPYGLEAKLMNKFHQRRKELLREQKTKQIVGFVKGLAAKPQIYSAKLGDYVKGTYKSQLSGIQKRYRSFGRWIGRVPYGGIVRRRRSSTKGTRTPTTPAPTKQAPTPQAGYGPLRTWFSGGPPTTNSTTKVILTETATVESTETKTKTETVTVTAFGVNLKEHAHDIKELVKDLDPYHIGAGVAVVACAAGCWFWYRGNRQEQVLPDVADVIMGEPDEEGDGEGNVLDGETELNPNGGDDEEDGGNDDDEVDDNEDDEDDDGDDDGDNQQARHNDVVSSVESDAAEEDSEDSEESDDEQDGGSSANVRQPTPAPAPAPTPTPPRVTPRTPRTTGTTGTTRMTRSSTAAARTPRTPRTTLRYQAVMRATRQRSRRQAAQTPNQ